MKKIALFLVPLFLSVFLFGEEGQYKTDFDFKSGLSFPAGDFYTFGKASSAFGELFSGVKTEKFFIPDEPAKLSQLNFSVSSFGLRFSPIVYLDKKKPQPCTSFYFGRLNYGRMFGKLKGNMFSKPKYGQNISVSKNGNLSLSTASLKSDFGFAFMLPAFELNYVASKNEKPNDFDHAVFCAFNGKDVPKIPGELYISAYTGVSASALGEKKHNTVFGSSIVYRNEYVGVQGDFASSVNTKKACGFSGGVLAQNFYEHCKIKIGVSANSKDFIAWKNTYAANTVSFYAAPEISFGLFTLDAFYNLERTGLRRSEKYFRGVETLEHSTGGKIRLENRHFRFVSALEYGKNMYSLDVKNAIYFPQLGWIKKLEAKFSCELLSKQINPYIVQKYTGGVHANFVPVKHLSLDGSFSFSQQNKLKKVKLNGVMTPVFQWQPFTVEGAVTLKYLLERVRAKNSFLLSVKGFTNEPHYRVALEYAVRF